MMMTSSIANLSTGSKNKMFCISYAIVRPQNPSTVLNFVGIKIYTVQIRVVHCMSLIDLTCLYRPALIISKYFFLKHLYCNPLKVRVN